MVIEDLSKIFLLFLLMMVKIITVIKTLQAIIREFSLHVRKSDVCHFEAKA